LLIKRNIVQAAELADTLDDPLAEFTVLAPNNAAFEEILEALGEDATAELLADMEALAEVRFAATFLNRRRMGIRECVSASRKRLVCPRD
jgi:hypothetical protein